MTARIGVNPRSRPSSDVGTRGISTNISPFGRLPQTVPAASLRPRPPTGRVRAMARPSIENLPARSRTACRSTAATRFSSACRVADRRVGRTAGCCAGRAKTARNRRRGGASGSRPTAHAPQATGALAVAFQTTSGPAWTAKTVSGSRPASMARSMACRRRDRSIRAPRRGAAAARRDADRGRRAAAAHRRECGFGRAASRSARHLPPRLGPAQARR